MNNKYQRVVLNGQSSSWAKVSAGVPQSILGLLFFLIYINDLSYGLSSSTKFFADNTLILSVVNFFIKLGLPRKLHNVLPRNSSITINKSFIRPPLGYGAIIFHQRKIIAFVKRNESMKYHAALVITRAIEGSSREKIYKELGVKTL